MLNNTHDTFMHHVKCLLHEKRERCVSFEVIRGTEGDENKETISGFYSTYVITVLYKSMGAQEGSVTVWGDNVTNLLSNFGVEPWNFVPFWSKWLSISYKYSEFLIVYSQGLNSDTAKRKWKAEASLIFRTHDTHTHIHTTAYGRKESSINFFNPVLRVHHHHHHPILAFLSSCNSTKWMKMQIHTHTQVLRIIPTIHIYVSSYICLYSYLYAILKIVCQPLAFCTIYA